MWYSGTRILDALFVRPEGGFVFDDVNGHVCSSMLGKVHSNELMLHRYVNFMALCLLGNITACNIHLNVIHCQIWGLHCDEKFQQNIKYLLQAEDYDQWFLLLKVWCLTAAAIL